MHAKPFIRQQEWSHITPCLPSGSLITSFPSSSSEGRGEERREEDRQEERSGGERKSQQEKERETGYQGAFLEKELNLLRKARQEREAREMPLEG